MSTILEKLQLYKRLGKRCFFVVFIYIWTLKYPIKIAMTCASFTWTCGKHTFKLTTPRMSLWITPADSIVLGLNLPIWHQSGSQPRDSAIIMMYAEEFFTISSFLHQSCGPYAHELKYPSTLVLLESNHKVLMLLLGSEIADKKELFFVVDARENLSWTLSWRP